MTKKSQKVVLYYDGDCAFCTEFVKCARRLPLQADYRPMQSVDLDSLGIDPVRSLVEVPSRQEDGTVYYGHRAISSVLQTGALPFTLIGHLMTWWPFNWLAAQLYRLVSQHRTQLSSVSSSCRHALITLKRARQGKTR